MDPGQSVRRRIEGRAVPVTGDDIDTDRIIPARYLREITFESLGTHAFADERFDAEGRPKEHPFNDPRFSGAAILLVNRDFGCGSSREHAPQSQRSSQAIAPPWGFPRSACLPRMPRA